MKIVKEESKGADVEMIDTSSVKPSAKANSWDVLCNISSEIQGTSEAEIQ